MTAGCSAVLGDPRGSRPDADPYTEEIPTGSATRDGQAADASVPPPKYRGNPLCRTTDTTCSPDDASSCGGKDGPPSGIDGGVQDSASPPQDACRVMTTSGPMTDAGPMTAAGPRCTESGSGRDGARCNQRNECSAGFDCVLGPEGGQCRRYCCSGTCAGVTSASGGATFCDVRQLAPERGIIPVCMAVKPCKLLAAGQCENSETCAVVTDEGTTGCVPIGMAQVGNPCDETHCAVGLTCLGHSGSRRCFQLCRVGGTSCGPSLQCKTSSLFKDTSYGICQAP